MDKRCDRKNALSGFVNMVTKEGVGMLMGPTCGVEIEVVGLFGFKMERSYGKLRKCYGCIMVHSHLRFSQLLPEPELIIE